MLAAVLLFAGVHFPPATPDVKPVRCEVTDSKVEGQPRVWLVKGWLMYPDGRTDSYLFAHREANEQKKALLDCYDFMQHYGKPAKKERK